MSTALTPANLVVVRAGDTSLHKQWLTGNPSWDLIVSYFGNGKEEPLGNVMRCVRCPGGKWEGIYDLLSSDPNLLNNYRYIWLPDDDVDADCETINTMFSVMEERSLILAQPSLHPLSYFDHGITLHNPAFQLRYSNFVELMVPCFRADFLGDLVPLFAGRRYGSGLDWIWAYMMVQPSLRTAVIDACVVTHTRPYRVGPLYTARGAPDPKNEAREILAVLGINDPPASVAYAGITRDGETLRGPSFAALAAIGGTESALRVRHVPTGSRAYLSDILANCISCSGDLGPLPFRIDQARLVRALPGAGLSPQEGHLA